MSAIASFYIFFLIFSEPVFATVIDKICIKNILQFEQHKSNLPAVIRKMPFPLYYTADIFFSQGLVAIKIEFDAKKNKFVLIANTRNLSEFDDYQNYIKEICIEDNTITLVPEAGGSLNTFIKSDSELTIKDEKNPTKDKVVVSLSSYDTYKKINQKINDANPNKETNTAHLAAPILKSEKSGAAQ